jgi:hypothetical protein
LPFASPFAFALHSQKQRLPPLLLSRPTPFAFACAGSKQQARPSLAAAAVAKSKGAKAKVVTLASFAFALQKSKAKVAQRAKGLRVFYSYLNQNNLCFWLCTFAFDYATQRQKTQRQKEQRLRLLPLPFAFASVASLAFVTLACYPGGNGGLRVILLLLRRNITFAFGYAPLLFTTHLCF